MKKFIIFLAFVTIGIFSCNKVNQSGLTPNQTVNFTVGSYFEIKMPGALPGTIKKISLTGLLQPVSANDKISLIFLPKGSEFCDTLVINPNVKVDNLDPMYFRFVNGKNVLQGIILVNDVMMDNLVFSGNLSFIYQN